MFREMNRSYHRFRPGTSSNDYNDTRNMSFKSRSDNNRRVKFRDNLKGSSTYTSNHMGDLYGSMLDVTTGYDMLNRTVNSSLLKK